MQGERTTSPWVWVGLGCLTAVVLGVAVVATLGYLGYQKVRELEAEMKDPAAREAAVLEVLGAEALPEGYHAMVGFSVPFLMKVAVLSDREPDPEGDPGGFEERGFIYVEMLQQGGGRDELRDYFEGRTEDAEILRQHDIRIDADEVLGRGTLQPEGGSILWLASRGNVQMARSASEGLTTLMLIECEPRDSRGRLGIWFGPDPQPDTAAAEVDFAGTPADPAAIESFLSPFSVCPR